MAIVVGAGDDVGFLDVTRKKTVTPIMANAPIPMITMRCEIRLPFDRPLFILAPPESASLIALLVQVYG